MDNREAAAAMLPEDVVLEILARVTDAAALFRCPTACKRWRALVADPSFLRRRWPENNSCHSSSSLLGFFNPQCRRVEGAGTIIPAAEPAGGAALSSAFIPAPRSSTTLAADRPFVMSSLVPGAAVHLDRATPLASYDGLLLVRFVPPIGSEPVPSGVVVDHLAVCDLLAGTCHVLPPLNCKPFFSYLDESGYAILTGDEAGCRRPNGAPGQQQPHPPPPPGYSTSFSFKVLIIGINTSNQGMPRYDMITYTSGEPDWSAPSKCFDRVERRIWGPIVQRQAVVCRGTAHWLFWDLADFHALAVNAWTGDVSLTKLPVVPPDDLPFHLYDTPRLTAAADDGMTLSLFCLYRKDLRLEIWTRRSSTADFVRTRVIGLKPPEQKKIDGALCLCSGETSGTLLISDRKRCMYIADIETGEMEELTTGRFCDDRKDIVSIEMDWSAFFMYRLGGQAAV